MEITRTLVDFSIKTTFDDLPESVVQKTKDILLDSVGCALGGYVTDRAKITLELAEDFGGAPQASIMGNRRTSCPLAAFVNSNLINALDYEAVIVGAPHAVSYVISPSLAIGERMGSSGKELIAAIALALEVAGRVVHPTARNRILKEEPPYYEEFPRNSFTGVTFGAVAGAGKLLQLDSTAMANAFGIAGVSTPVQGLTKWGHTPGPSPMVKYNLWSGWVSQLATVAVLAAERGHTGDTTILDGEWGFWQIMGAPFVEVDKVISDLGKTWRGFNVSYKTYPCCYIKHTGIRGISKIVRENEIKVEDIEEILVKGDQGILSPCQNMTELKTFEDGMFSNAYAFALAACYRGKPGPNLQMPSSYNDPVIRNLMGKVKVGVHPQREELIVSELKGRDIHTFTQAIVELTAKGKKFTAEVYAGKGAPSDPITDEELKEKFRNNASYSPLRSDKIEKVIETISELEKVDDVTKLMRLLTIE